MTTQNKPERGEQWHIEKEIPIALFRLNLTDRC